MIFSDLDSSDGIQDVSQSGSWTVAVSNFPATQAISAASLPLPTGAATETTLAALSAKLNSLGQKTMANSAPVVIASDQSAIPVSVQSTASDEKATFCVCARGVAIGNNKSMVSIMNESGSSIVLKLRELYIINVQNVALTGVTSEFQLFRITGHSGGTNVDRQTYDTQDSPSASFTAKTGATVSGEASNMLRRWTWSSDEWGPGATDVESLDHQAQIYSNLMAQFKGAKPFTLRAGEGLHIKHSVNSTAGTFDVVAIFTQEAA